MISRPSPSAVAAGLFASVLVVAACTRDLSTLGPAQFPADAEVFDDGFGPGVGFGAFGGSKLDALSVDLATKHSGTNSFHVTVPAPGDPTGGYAGGAWFSGVGRDLSGYNALTFWAKSSIPATLNTAGFGNDNAGNVRFLTEVVGGLPLTTAWKKYVIPIPDPKKLTRERGLFEFAEGPENGAGYDIWFDEAKFEKLSTIVNPRPIIPTGTSQVVVGQTVRITGGTATYTVNGADETVTVAPDYFTYLTSNPTVATVGADGTISVVGAGNATITARLGNVDAAGSLALTAIPLPTTAAPAPTQPASDVISLFSNAYPNVTVDKWSADWDQADVADIKIAGDDVKLYTNIGYAGIEFISQQINATLMTTLHLDVYVLDATTFKIKLIDFGGNGVFGGGDDTEQQLTFTTPAITANAWNSLDIPLSAFTGLTSRNHLAQMVIEGSSPVVYLDNLYFWGRIVPPSPTDTAATPTVPAGNVISLFSNAYTNVPVDTWLTSWSAAQSALVDPYLIAGHAVKKYSLANYAGIEFIGTAGAHLIDASSMTSFHMDVWSPEAQHMIVKIHDAGADGVVGTSDDSEGLFAIGTNTVPGLTGTGQWISLNIPFSAFTVSVGSVWNRSHLAQIVLVEDTPTSGGTVYVDHMYFTNASSTASAPTNNAPAPTVPAASVISLFSTAYTNQGVDTWQTSWSTGNSQLVDPFAISGGHPVKKYSLSNFVGVEFGIATPANTVDATAMTHFHVDVWSPNPASNLEVQLVNDPTGAGAIGHYQAGQIATGGWVSLDIPLASFTGLNAKNKLQQLLFVGAGPMDLFIDNVYFYTAGAPPTAPTTNAPAPTVSAANVISLFSTAYTNQGVDTWQTSWSTCCNQLVDPFAIAGGHPVKKYSLSNFVGVEFGIATPANTVDASAMTHFHVDVWSPNPSSNLEVQLVNDPTGTAAIGHYQAGQVASGSWVSLDIPLASFTGLSAKNKLQQLLFVGAGPMDLFIDNVYFYNSAGGGPGGSHVFFDGYDSGVSFADFGGATNAVSVDATTINNGRSSFKAIITGSGGYSGGAFVASAPRDLSAFNALTFWAKASTATSSLKVGIGNNALNTRFNAEAIGIPLTTTFQKFIIPLPDPSKLTSYDGLFHFADGPNNYTVWFNDVQYENLPAGQVGAPTGATTGWSAQTVALGSPFQINPAPNTVSYTTPALPNGGKLTDVAWRWFTLTSSNPAVATVDADGLVTGVAAGTTNISATMNGIAVAGNAPITVTAPLGVPANNAPTPSLPAANVISLFSTAYTNQGVDTWQTSWSTCCNQLVDPFAISGGHAVKQYTLSNFVGIEFGIAAPANTVDASAMTHFHVDVWSPNPSTNLEIQLVNDPTGAAAIGHYQAGQFASGSWVSLDIPLSSFTGLSAKNKLQQLLFVGAGPTVLYIDNVYFHN